MSDKKYCDLCGETYDDGNPTMCRCATCSSAIAATPSV
ncbi:hypothetical protein FRUB_02576 [Fimbriiglobus ruber]|uniref:Uncharacterized protein n=1 Tax=Fimbriiglobus ruber TaxID=1908690 RepID=A0A225E3K9_9BACT|nr:hypothetical protein FRUB_02576 [Fimbriiglobus ruber]